MPDAPHLTILHLSDLQIGRHHRFESDTGLGSLLDRIGQDLDKLRETEAIRPDLVLLTGDLSEWGMDGELDQVRRFAEGLRDFLRLPTRRVVMLPGNHDINRKLCEGYFAIREGRGKSPSPPYFPKYEPYAEMFGRFYTGEPDIRFNEEQPWTFVEIPDLRVVVAALNSTIADSHRPDHHYGFIGEAQIRWFVEKLRPYRDRGWLRVGAVHHDILEPEAEPARQDKTDLKTQLAPYLNILFHGHRHAEDLQWLDASVPVPVLGIGSAGVKAAERPAEVPNQYQVVQIFADRVVFGRRSYVPDKKVWMGCLRSDPGGAAWKVERKVVFERVEETFSASVASVPAPETDLAAQIERYREAWARTESRMGLFDIAARGEDADVARGLDLLGIFVPPKARREPAAHDLRWEHGEDELPARSPRKGWRHSRDRDPGRLDPGSTSPEPVEMLLAAQDIPWIVLLGAPGAGKTALTRWLGLKLCVPGESLGEGLRDLLPLRIELRQFAEAYRRAKEVGRSYDFFEHIDETHRERSIDLRGEPLRRLADAGRIVWLFDGLDEVPEARLRREIAKMIVGVSMRYAGRGVVTSRIAGATPALPVLERAGLSTYTLADFDDGAIEAFIERWHAQAFPDALDVAEKRKERLRRTLRESRPVRELVKNPLLLTLVALLNRGAELPRRRHLIYEQVVDLLVDRWEANKHPANSGGCLDMVEKKKLLRLVAWKMMTELPDGGGNVIHEDDLRAIVAGFCERTLGESNDRAQHTALEIINELRERNGLLVLLGSRLFGFLHKTLLEYLAAAEAMGRFRSHEWDLEALKDLFRKRWNEQEWAEVLTLICGMLQDDRPAHVVEMAQGVLEHVGPFDDDRNRAVGFAVRCMSEVRDMQQEPVRSMAMILTEHMTRGEEVSSKYGLAGVARVVTAALIWERALRFGGPEWPGASVFRDSATHAASVPSLLCAIATSRRDGRVAFVREILGKRALRPALSLSVAKLGELGLWRREEVEALLAILDGEPLKETVACITALVSAGAVSVSPKLMILAERFDLEDSQESCKMAAALQGTIEGREIGIRLWKELLDKHGVDGVVLRADWHTVVEAATYDERLRARIRDAIIDYSVSSKDSVPSGDNGVYWRYSMLRAGALAWRSGELLDRWVEIILTVDWYFDDDIRDVYRHRHVWRQAAVAMERLVSELNRLPERSRLSVAQILFEEGDGRSIPLLEELASPTNTSKEAVHATALLAEVPERAGAMILRLLTRAGAENGAAATAQFYLRKLAVESPEAEAALLAFASNPVVPSGDRLKILRELAGRRSQGALRIVEQLAVSAEAEHIRRDAAELLQKIDEAPTVWRPVLEQLSRSAKTGSLRLQAAKALRDEKRIRQLARKAKNRDVREAASRSLEALRRYHAILAVGKKRRGKVSANGILVGHIEETDAGSRFTYDPAYLARRNVLPLAPTLPLRKEPYDSAGLHPFFENLLPEGWLLDVTCRKLGLERGDAFGLLLATCGETAGDVEIAPKPKVA